ncbi:MAG TPA: PqqD family protein [Gemmatimonadales bacterium]|nr:PqqD family protein [Gemmatimonadales bacterium]
MTRCFRAHPDLRLTALEGEGVVLHLGSRRYFSVNETGLAILEQLKPRASLPDVVAALTSKFEVSEAQAERSATAFLDRCLASHLVEEEPC